jgi:hypothetical protein
MEKQMNKARKLWTGSLFAAALVIAIPAGIAFAQTPTTDNAPKVDQQAGPGQQGGQGGQGGGIGGPGQRGGQGGQGGQAGGFGGQGGQGGGFGGQGGQGGPMMGGGGGSISADNGNVYVLQGNRVLKLNSDLKIVAQVELPRPMGPGGPPPGGGEDQAK